MISSAAGFSPSPHACDAAAFHIDTPLLHSVPMSMISGVNVYAKMDALQPSGSFKIRGVGYACRRYLEMGRENFVAASGGNAGLAVAYAAKMLGAKALIVVPRTTKGNAIEAIEAEGAHVVIHGSTWFEAHIHALTLTGPRDAYIHPFDDPFLWEGHATIIDEMTEAGIIPDAIVVAVGGGGLLAGVAIGIERNGWKNTQIIGVETVGADCLSQSMHAGNVVQLNQITSVATSLGTAYACTKAFEVSQQPNFHNIVVTDAEAITATKLFLRHHRVAVEVACGAALAAIYEGHIKAFNAQDVVVIACGGVGIRYDDLF
jgi:L-serine/L-threonine ammonia-lyase